MALAKWPLLERRHSVYHGLLKPNRICRLGETSEPSMKEIHRHVHRSRAWHKKFMETGTVLDRGRSGGKRRSCKKSSTILMGPYRGVLNEAKKKKKKEK